MTTPAPHRLPAGPQPSPRHGDDRVDEWYWLREKDSPEVIAHLEAENAYTEALTAHTAKLRETLFEEIRSHVVETDLSVPTLRDGWWYYSRTIEGKAYGSLLPGGRGDRRPHAARAGRDRGGPWRAGAAGLQRRGRGPRVLLARCLRHQPRLAAARVGGRRHRRRGLHAALPRPAHRRGPAGRRRGRLLRLGVGERQRDLLLHPAGQRDAAVPGVAARARHAGDRRRDGVPGGRRELLPRRRPDQGRRRSCCSASAAR